MGIITRRQSCRQEFVSQNKQKAFVEGTIGKIAIAIIVKFRNEVFYSFENLKDAAARKLYEFNYEWFQKRAYFDEKKKKVLICCWRFHMRDCHMGVWAENKHIITLLSDNNCFPVRKKQYSTHAEDMLDKIRFS